MFELIGRLDELIYKQSQLNAIFVAVFSNYFYSENPDRKSEHESERFLASDLISQYGVYSKLLHTGWDISFELEKELEKVSEGFMEEWKEMDKAISKGELNATKNQPRVQELNSQSIRGRVRTA